jgi:HK97 family phage portal protein
MRIWPRREQRTIPKGGAVWPDGGWAPFAPPSATGALAVADVYACVRVLAGAAASLPLIPYRRSGSGRVRLSSGRLHDLLQQPSPARTQADLTGQTMTHLLLYGNAFLAKYRGADGRLEQLALLNPEYVQVELVAGNPRYTVTDPKTGQQSYHGTDDIVHIRALSTDGLAGLSPLKECRLAVDYAQGMGEFAAAFTRHGMRPSGFISIPGGLNRNQFETLRFDLEARHEGAWNAHRIAILTGDATYTAMTGPLDDLQFAEQRRLSTAEIARIFGVPVWMINGSSGDSLTYANAEAQQLMFAIHSLRPWLVLIEQAISADPDLCSQNVYVEFLLDALLRADSATRADVYTKALNPATGWMTRAEVRQLENLEPEAASAQPVPQQNGSGVLIS